MKFKGTVHRYGRDIDTDVIIPARYLNTSDPAELAKHCLEDLDTEFVNNVQPGDIIVAGPNFGCGSSREHAPLAIKSCGVKCVIAPSFARIFYRNAINIGFPIMECAQAAEEIQAGEDILRALDLKHGVRFVSCPTCGRTGIDLISIAKQVEQRTRDITADIKIAVMGCVVNGPGEAREADIGIAGAKGEGIIFKKGEVIRRVPEEKLVDELMDEVGLMLGNKEKL